jgi:hypothetical protein
MKTTYISLVLVAIFFSNTVAQERQVSFDSAGMIMSIDKGLEHSLSLFPGIEYFEEARLFQRSDDNYTVEITKDSNHDITRMHIGWSSDERDLARRRIGEYAMREHPEMYIDQKGRGNLMLGVTMLSIFAWGPSLPLMLDMHDPAQITGAYLLFGGGAYLLGSVLTSRMEVTPGEASFANSGGLLGLGHGALLALVFEGDNIDSKSVAALSTIASVGELIINYNIAKRTQMTTGTASVLSSGATFGALYGGATALVFSEEPSIQVGSALALAGSIGGYFLGDILARNHSYADGDATALSLAASFGAIIPLMNLAAADVNDHTVLAGMTIAGSIAAAAIIHEATRNTGFTTGQGLTLSLGTLAGTLMGSGLGLLAKADFQAGVMLASLGTIAGYGITFVTMAHSQSATSHVRSQDKGSLDIQLNPVGIVTAFKGSLATSELAGVKYHF